jgi:hypothetical protein
MLETLDARLVRTVIGHGRGGWPALWAACLVVTTLASCGRPTPELSGADLAYRLRIHHTPSPFLQVSAGPVRALIPDGWHPRLAGPSGDPREGLVATPGGRGWTDTRTPREGLAAVWIDGTRVGVPSDYYYLAATGPALDMLTGNGHCQKTGQVVYANHLPTFAAGPPDSPGDFIASGQGTCSTAGRPTHWAYFVAAPGYGPARTIGIPSSGLYVVVAVLPDSPSTPALLDKLLQRTQFAGASITDFIHVTQAAST